MGAVNGISQSITRRKIQVVLGLLWLLDGTLQLQHQMFSGNFITQVINPAVQGQPKTVAGFTHLAIRIFLSHPALFNSLIVIVQLGLGVLILMKKTVKLGLILSVFWGIFVWYGGEGAGGIFSAHTLILMGAPGAALIYAILALAVLPDSIEGKHPAYWLAFVWAGLWIGGAIYQLLPGQNSISDLSGTIAGNANGAPGWLATLDNHVASFINGLGTSTQSMANMHMTASQMAMMQTTPGSGYWFILILGLVQASIGIAVFIPGYTRKLAIGLGILLSIVFWFIGQSLGGYYTGLATDPNSAPLFILLGVAVLGSTKLDKSLTKLYSRAVKIAT